VSDPALQDQRYAFSRFTLEARQRRLVAADGRVIRLGTKAFDTLLYFVQHAGETVAKHRLLTAVWPNVVVQENSLFQAVSSLRRALRPIPDGEPCILTIPGVGYRFVPSVELLSQPRAPRSSLAQPSIAFLPIENLTGASRHDADADALAEELTMAFADNAAYLVVTRHSTFKYKGRSVDPRDVRRDLGVDYVVEGSLVEAVEGLRLSIRLIDAASGGHVWIYSITSVDGSLDAFRREIGIGGTGLTVYLQCALWRHYVAAIGGENPAVLLGRLRPETLALAAVCRIYGRDDVSERELHDAGVLLEKAVELCPRNVHALTLCGMFLVGLPTVPELAVSSREAKDRYARGVALFDRALSVGQGGTIANNLSAIGLWLAGRWKRAHPLIERAVGDFPYPMLRVYAEQWRLLVEGDTAETIGSLGRALATERNQTHLEQHSFPYLIGLAHLATGEPQAAVAHLERARAVAPAEHAPLAALVAAQVIRGNLAEARRLAAAHVARTSSRVLRDTPLRRACLHPARSGIDPASSVGHMVCATIPRALRSLGLSWATPPEDAEPSSRAPPSRLPRRPFGGDVGH
jgi:DNA-binding winged helix-turn-helix (wHTH) protein